MSDLKPVRTNRAPGANFDLVRPPDVTYFAVDGFGEATIGLGVAKLQLTVTTDIRNEPDVQGPIEMREVRCIVSMPTKALLEFCRNTLMTMQSAAGEFEQALDAEKSALLALIKSTNSGQV